MEIKSKKQVKVHGKFRASQSRRMFADSGNKIVPWLTVSGLWLEKLGFKVGDRVNITSSNKLLIIERLEEGDIESRAVV